MRIHIGPWLVLLVQNHLLNSMTIFMKILHGYSAVLLTVCVCFCNPSSITIMRLMRTLYSHGHSLELQEWKEFFTLFFLNTDQSNLSVISFFSLLENSWPLSETGKI